MKLLRLLYLLLCFVLLTGCLNPLNPTTTCTQAPISEPSDSTEATNPPNDPAITVPVFDPLLIVETMSTEEKVGQLFLACCPDANAINDLQTYHLGGYILFDRDFNNETPDSMTQKIQSYQAASALPLLIAVDEEGGTVNRVSNHSAFRSSRFQSPRKLYASGGMELVLNTEKEKALLLSSLGINVNMAPVCDLSTNPSAFMYDRSLGVDPQTTGAFATRTSAIMAQHGVGSVLKHFPGYGNNSDTHTGIAVDSRTLTELESADLIPFSIAIENGCGAILVSHTIINCLDTEHPATLSPAVHQYMREKMGFSGVIITDELSMGAIAKKYSIGEAAVLAVLAGNDLLCTTYYSTQYNAVLEAVKSQRIPESTLDDAVCRILQWKFSLGLLETNTTAIKNS